MADDADELEIEQDEAPEIEEEIETPEGEGAEEEVVTFGDEAQQQSSDTGLAKHLRGEIAKRDRELAELRARAPAQQQIDVGDEPSMADPSINYDEDKFKAEWRDWNDRKAKAEQQKNQVSEADQSARAEWQRDHQSYQAKRANLTFADRDETEAVALQVLNPAQQVTIVKAADNPALFLYALGKYPDRLAEIAAIQDPIKLAKAIAKIEGTINVTKTRRAPDPERVSTGTGRISHQTADKRLEGLEKEADRTGDRTKLIAYKRQLAQNAK